MIGGGCFMGGGLCGGRSVVIKDSFAQNCQLRMLGLFRSLLTLDLLCAGRRFAERVKRSCSQGLLLQRNLLLEIHLLNSCLNFLMLGSHWLLIFAD